MTTAAAGTATTGSGPRLVWANSLRGIAAALVMLGHLLLGVVAMQAFAESSVRFPVGAALQDPLHLGQVAHAIPFDVMGSGVCLFFLLSGLVISRSLRRYSRSGFLVGRVMRLLPTYAAGYVVVVLAVTAAALLAGNVVPFGVSEVAGLVPGLPQVLGVTVIPNDVAWTLVVEMTFYLVCMVLYRGLLGRPWVLITVAVGCGIAQFALLNVSVISVPFAGARDLLLVALPFLPVLLIGVHLDGIDTFRLRDCATVGLLALAFVWMTQFRVWWPFSPLGTHGAGVTYQATYLVTIAVFIAVWRFAGSRLNGPVLRWLAAISYPLYVVHLMVGWVVILGLVSVGLPLPVAQVTAISIVLLLAWLLHISVEAPTHRIGRRWARHLSKGNSAPQVHDSSEPSKSSR